MKNNKPLTYLFLILLFSLGINLYFGVFLPKGRENISPVNNSEKNYLVSPLKQGETTESEEALHYAFLKPKLEEAIPKTSGIEEVGLFLQNSKTGAWLGINEKSGFVPSSLLKVPIMMAVLKKFERQEIKMTDEIELLPGDLDESSGDLYKMGAGAKLTYWELIKKMILFSDNTAKNSLRRQLTGEELNAIFSHVGIPNPYKGSPDNALVTPRDYIRLFKSLFFATFLTPELSQKALDLTTEVDGIDSISAGVPKDIQTAHKFSERPDGFSDCGIVYRKNDPYFLCIMIKTKNPENKALITKISKIIYDLIEEQSTSQ